MSLSQNTLLVAISVYFWTVISVHLATLSDFLLGEHVCDFEGGMDKSFF